MEDLTLLKRNMYLHIKKMCSNLHEISVFIKHILSVRSYSRYWNPTAALKKLIVHELELLF